MTFSDTPNAATIQVASLNDPHVRQNISCCFQGMEGKRLSLVSPSRLAPYTAISVEYNDTMFLGEVVACTQDCAEAWHIEVKVEQILTGLQSLIMLRARLLGEGIPAAVAAPAMVTARTTNLAVSR
jgi:hypothetical protein